MSTPNTGSLPVPLTRLIGRDDQLHELDATLASTRLLTLTGAGGSGKTRLALELARCMAEKNRDVVWVELAPVTEPEAIGNEIAAAAGVRDPASEHAPERLLEALCERSCFVVLDNCEHLVDDCARVATELLRGCPCVRILATSREALGIAGEQVWLVPPLAVPGTVGASDLAALEASAAVQLFVERARAVVPAFQLTPANALAVAEICRRLDGLPLAIELAAARVKVLSPEQIADRLADTFRLLTTGGRTALARHRTLRAAIDWSHALLSKREQTLLRRLSVFAAAFSLDAAERVCACGELPEEEVLDALAALVDKSLVALQTIDGEASYRLLETVRQYAAEKLREAGEEAAWRRRHGEFFVALVEAAEPYIWGGYGDPRWMERLDRESDNLRSAAAWLENEPSGVELAMRMVVSLHWYWFARGRFSEGRHRAAAALAMAAEAPPYVRGKTLIAAGHLAFWQGDFAAVRAPMAAGLALVQDDPDRHTRAYALNGLGIAHLLEGDPTTAGELCDQARETIRREPPSVLQALIGYWRGLAAQARGELQHAREYLEEAAAIGRAIGHKPATGHPLAMLARLTLAQDELPQALVYLAETLTIHGETEDLWGLTNVIRDLAQLAARSAQPEVAARLLGASQGLGDAISYQLSPQELQLLLRLEHELHERLGRPEFQRLWEAGRTARRSEMVTLGLGLIASLNAAAAPAPETGQTASKIGRGPEKRLRVKALGPLEVSVAGKTLKPGTWGSGRLRELLVFLLLHPEGVSKDEVGLALWPDASPEQVRNSFHVALHRLRKTLGGSDWISAAGDRYRLEPDLPAELDALSFERKLGSALRALRAGKGSPSELLAPLELYRGELLEGAAAGEWIDAPRRRFEQLYLEGLLACAEGLIKTGQDREASEVLRRMLERDPLDEEVCRKLMACHARLGEPTVARQLYRQLEKALEAEVGAPPEPKTTALLRKIESADSDTVSTR